MTGISRATRTIRMASIPQSIPKAILARSDQLHFSRQRRFLLRSEEHTSELQSRGHLVCRLLLEKKKLGLAESPRRRPWLRLLRLRPAAVRKLRRLQQRAHRFPALAPALAGRLPGDHLAQQLPPE